jgi:translation initiation factor IF-2
MTERPPIIAILGHIDHGKSTLLDYIRKSNITDKEVGGITQNMSAYEVMRETSHGLKKITFLDTPGHEAFQELRGRGARVADIGILIVSAEDGVKAQTIEALRAIKEARLPFIVAINKIDRPGADINRTKQSLAENEVFVEGYGGSIPSVPISAITGEGVDDLLEMISLVSEMEQLNADSSLDASGVIIETNRDQKKGISATLIIKNGVLKSGMHVVAGESYAPVRIFEDFQGKTIKEATFSSPVRVVGFDSLPPVGVNFDSFKDKKTAEEKIRENKVKNTERKSAESNFDANTSYVPLIIKANTSGVIEAIIHEIKKLETDKIKARIVLTGIGDISENDIKLASGGSENNKTMIIGFSNKVDSLARMQAERFGIEVQTFEIIYKINEWLEEKFKERTPKVEVEEEKGRVKILKVFSKNKDKQIIGGRVEEGKINVNDDVIILRRDSEIGRGKVRELQQGKQKTSEVLEGTEFGTMIESKIEIAPGDYVRPFAVVTK